MSFVLPSVSQRWSSRGHILKSLALASKSLKMPNYRRIFFLFLEDAWKIYLKVFFFGEHLRLVFLAFERVSARKVGPWSWHRIFLGTWPRALCPRLYLCLFPLIFPVGWPKISSFASFWFVFDGRKGHCGPPDFSAVSFYQRCTHLLFHYALFFQFLLCSVFKQCLSCDVLLLQMSNFNRICATSSANHCWALGGIICNFTPILTFFQHWVGWTSTKTFFRWANY